MSGSKICFVACLFAGLTLAPDAAGQRQQRRAAPQRQATRAQTPDAGTKLPDGWVEELRWRSIGPANMSGRITALAVVESDPSTWWAATASGGLLKTTNNGINFEHQFDKQATVSIGDVQVAQSDPEIVWVGTGESNPRNSVSWGDGVYKSVDGGKTWKNMGLEESYQIGRIAIHPENPDIVYVGAMGRLWGENEERGLFKTTDGGETWNKILYVDARTGVIDVNMHPADPDTLLVATYERQRDGFDGNDPIKKWGPGSGLWKSTDAGESFRRVQTGLPTQELGRIDVEYFRSDPNTVYALVESSRIGLEPEDAAFLGLNGTNADVGARVTDVTAGSPAEAAGLKEGDIVIALGDETVHSYTDLVAKVRRHLAGDTTSIEVSRERKSIVADLTFARYPEAVEDPTSEGPIARGRRAAAPDVEVAEAGVRRAESQQATVETKTLEAAISEAPTEVFEGAPAEEAVEPATKPGEEAVEEQPAEESDAEENAETEEEENAPEPRTTFRTRLGGQVPNVQDQQGPEGHEYGGLYKSTDGGETWTRINSVNPRPMYFSQLRVDPSDDQHIYVLGVSLYRSKDGGETFTGDGGRGVHADQHALWIDPADGRHGILGNDGGVYVTYDRLDNWDHYNHVAIGQFYHVTVGPRVNYRVYGGLQDNGSWGGPVRSRSGGGTVNEDWFNIGGGDGFICRVDPADPDQIYFESQNGSLGRRNLRTGERASLRPRAPRGTRYRWNWMTPFILSNHNSGIYYTAGNFVFRSWLRGDDLKAISPEITNTDKGSGSALAESPLDPDVLYVGTTDGALWMTRNGGVDWTNLFVPGKEPAPTEQPRTRRGDPITASFENGSTGNGNGEQEPAQADPISGLWTLGGGGAAGGRQARGGQGGGRRGQGGAGAGSGFGGMAIELARNAEGALSGSMSSPRGDSELSEGTFDPEQNSVHLVFGADDFATTIDAKLEGGSLKGTLDFGGRFQREFEATRGEAKQERNDGYEWKTIAELLEEPMWVSSLEPSRFEAGRVYMAIDGHRSDSDDPYIFVSEDYGASWRSLAAGLPEGVGSSRILREDIENPDILYLGAEFGAWVSIDRGTNWTRLNSNLPTVAVHELAQHPTTGDIVAATHGRSLWVLDVTPLRQFTKSALEATAQLYRPAAVYYWRSEPRTGGTLRRFRSESLPSDAELFYSVGEGVRSASLRVKRPSGEVLAELETSTEPGLHRASWGMRPTSSGNAQAQGFRGGFRRGGPRVEPGTYVVELVVGNQTFTEPLEVRGDPEYPSEVLWGEEYERQIETDYLLKTRKREPEETSPAPNGI